VNKNRQTMELAEAREEAHEELFELLESGVSLAEAKKILRGETATTNPYAMSDTTHLLSESR
jgi:hypothetical protein